MLSTYYFFLNTQQAPFDKLEVRQAVHFGLDKRALIAAGRARAMRPGCSLLPPELQTAPQPCPFGDPAGPPQLDRARQMIAAAGAAGARVAVYTSNEQPALPLARNFAAQLDAMGLDTTVQIIDGASYFQTVGQGSGVQAGFANWFADFAHPRNFLFLVDPRTTQPSNNQNFSHTTDPQISSAIDEGRYDDADRLAVESGAIVPYGHLDLVASHRGRIADRCIVGHPLYGLDFSRLCRS
jgi:peptide/nickel transport system substrate-binding protein